VISGHAQENNIILLTNPKITMINIVDNHESLIDLKNHREICYGPSPEISDNMDYTWIRKTVYDKLIQAQKSLPEGIRFCLYEGYRSLKLQKMLFENRFRQVAAQHPDWPKDKIFKEATKLVSPVKNIDGTKITPPHSTGGAIDIYLIDEKAQPLDMGIHPKDWMEDHDGSISLTLSQKISAEAKKNRMIMNQALSAAGFVNYAGEYWHWSYGDRYWAYFSNQPHAIYGSYKR